MFETNALSELNRPPKTDSDPESNHLDDSDQVRLLKARIEKLEQEIFNVSNKGKLIAQELDLFRQRRVVFWSDRFRNTFDAWNLMHHSFQQLKDDSLLFHKGIQKFRLQPSYSLLRVPYLTYSLHPDRPNLCGILLAPILDVPVQAGEICIRIFSEPDNLVAACNRSVSEIVDDEPVLFEFPAIACSHSTKLHMRVYVQAVDAPIRIFELRHYELGGFGRLKTKPFVGFLFADSQTVTKP
ncbi:MAG: hypothetical protein P4L53_27075 [Candidatus Obscuribacterales bacterium]|nr:hypothetical protein [Candidatus Obscuribacterales bacterium]